MKRALFLATALCLVAFFAGCSKDDDDNNNNNNPTAPLLADTCDLSIVVPDVWPDSLVIDTVNNHGETCPAVRVRDFFMLHFNEVYAIASPGTHDDDSSFFAIFTYVPYASDGFTCRNQAPNIRWDQLLHGYFDITDPAEPNLFYDIDMIGKHRINGVDRIDLYRTVQVWDGDSCLQFELMPMGRENHATTDSTSEPAIMLASFISDYVTASPDSHTYTIKASDDYGPSTPLTWAQLQTGWWLTVTQKTSFTDSTLTTGAYKLRNFMKITLN